MLYNIIAPSPPPQQPPPPPPPPQPMMDFQRWCLAAAVLTGDQLLFAPIKQHLVDHRRMAGAYTRPLFSSTGALLCDRGCSEGLFRGCLGGDRGYEGCLGCSFVSETAQDELNSGRV